MEFEAILSAVLILSTGLGGWLQGRTAGTSAAFQTASDTVGMLSVQLAIKETHIAELTRTNEAMARHCAMCIGPRQGNSEGSSTDSGDPHDRGNG